MSKTYVQQLTDASMSRLFARKDPADDCIARYIATGQTEAFLDFLRAEEDRGTKSADLIVAVSMAASSMCLTALVCMIEPKDFPAGVKAFGRAFASQLNESANAIAKAREA